MQLKKRRLGYVLWPVAIVAALGAAGACSSSSGGGVGADGTGGNGNATGGGGGASSGGNGQAGSGDAGADGKDLCEGVACSDDGNPCTEDVCNPATGECGVPRTGTVCDDGIFCNGEDECVDGECTAHEGNPCGDGTCNESGAYCECSVDEDCPDDIVGAWSDCAYGANVCSEAGTTSRTVTTYSCSGEGKCVQDTPAIENDVCNRETDGDECPDDGLFCNGEEACSSGNCVGAGNPCTGTPDTPYCSEGRNRCEECVAYNVPGDDNTGCGGSEFCCNGFCQNEACLVIITISNPTIGIPTISNPTISNPTFP